MDFDHPARLGVANVALGEAVELPAHAGDDRAGAVLDPIDLQISEALTLAVCPGELRLDELVC